MFIFADKSSDIPESGDQCAQKEILRRRFGNSGWECPQILEALDAADELYFDRVSQIRMDPQPGSWSRDRVTLVGDAASCVSFLAGQGSALAMTAAYILADELHRAGEDYGPALRRYVERFRPFVESKQKAALGFAGAFAPKSKLALWLRNWVMNLLSVPWVADLVMGRDFSDRIAL